MLDWNAKNKHEKRPNNVNNKQLELLICISGSRVEWSSIVYKGFHTELLRSMRSQVDNRKTKETQQNNSNLKFKKLCVCPIYLDNSNLLAGQLEFKSNRFGAITRQRSSKMEIPPHHQTDYQCLWIAYTLTIPLRMKVTWKNLNLTSKRSCKWIK